jgi:predicted secreted protein
MLGRLIIVLALFGLTAATALAGDAAERDILGFSPDGRYFALEQYGIEDGSGFPYSEVFIIDLTSDSWLEGTPVRVRLDDETQTLQSARRQALGAAQPFLATAQIADNATLLASNVIYQNVADARQLTFRGFYTSFGHLEPIEPAEDAISLVLEEIVLPAPKDCPAGDTPLAGFVLKAKHGSGPFEEIYRDKAIPTSRRCPLKYSLSDAVSFTSATGQIQRLVVIVNVFAYGFEGPNRRFVAISVQ